MTTKINDYTKNSLKSVQVGCKQSEKMEKMIANYKALGKEWVKCKELNDNKTRTTAQYAQLMTRLVKGGFAVRKIVDDGLIEVPQWEYVRNVDNPYDEKVALYDKDGEFVGMFVNPKWAEYNKEHGNGRGDWMMVTKMVHTSHAEFKILV